jgi:phage shock protein A
VAGKQRPDPADDRDGRVERELADLRREYESLKEQKVRAEQDVANLTRQIEELSARALAEYGTADTEALARLLEEKRRENERLVAEYREHVQAVARELSAVEGGEPREEGS